MFAETVINKTSIKKNPKNPLEPPKVCCLIEHTFKAIVMIYYPFPQVLLKSLVTIHGGETIVHQSKGKARGRTRSRSLIPLFCSCLCPSDGHHCSTLSTHRVKPHKRHLSLFDYGDMCTCTCFSVQLHVQCPALC